MATKHARSLRPIPPLRAVREARGLSLRELGRRVDLDPTFLSRVERGEERLSVRSLERVAEALELRELTRLLAPWITRND